MSPERDYVLGTHDEESARLLLQHRVWRPRALDAWRRAGFTVGQTLLDLGCGPGHAAVDPAWARRSWRAPSPGSCSPTPRR